MQLRDLVVGAVVMLACGCERADSNCTKLWDSAEALRDFGHAEACKRAHTSPCPPRDKAGERSKFVSQCKRWPAEVPGCLMKDEPLDSACQALLERCKTDPACKDAVAD